MKVLQLTVHYHPNIGGVETHLVDLVNELIAKKHEVLVLAYKPLTAKVGASIWESKEKLKILRLPWFGGLFYKFVHNPFLEFLYLAPLIFVSLPFVILFFRPNVMHTHGLIAGFIGVFWGNVLNIKTLTTTHSLYHFPEDGMYRKFAKWIFENSYKVLTLSKLSKKEIEELGIESEKIIVFTYWVNLNYFKKVGDAKKSFGWHKKFVVFSVGRLVDEKGIKVLLESFRLWSPVIYLAIAGTGPLEDEIKDLAVKHNNLIFLGKISNDKLAPYYSASDIVIIPSIHDEGFGRIILESLACGTPVVAANRGAIPEAMDQSVGVLIDITPENIYSQIEFLYKHPNVLGKLSNNARFFAEKRYSRKNFEIIAASYI